MLKQQILHILSKLICRPQNLFFYLDVYDLEYYFQLFYYVRKTSYFQYCVTRIVLLQLASLKMKIMIKIRIPKPMDQALSQGSKPMEQRSSGHMNQV